MARLAETLEVLSDTLARGTPALQLLGFPLVPKLVVLAALSVLLSECLQPVKLLWRHPVISEISDLLANQLGFNQECLEVLIVHGVLHFSSVQT